MAEAEEISCNRSLICPLCLDIFDKATLLFCGHTFCKACLQNLDNIKRKNPNHLTCPVCRRKCMLGNSKVNGLPPNNTVNSLVDDYKNHKSLSASSFLVHSSVEKRQQDTKIKPVPAIRKMRVGVPSSGSEQPSSIPPKVPDRPRRSVDNNRTDLAVSASPSIGNYEVPSHFLEPPRKVPLIILKVVDLPAGIRDMALFAPETVLIVYGSSLHGAQLYKSTGDHREHFHNLGAIRSVAILTDGRAVISLGKEGIQECNIDGKLTARQFRYKNFTKYYYVCCDHCNNLYAVNGNPEIYSFVLGKDAPERVIPTGKMIPSQVCVAKSGAIIVSSGTATLSIVAIFDKNGCIGSCVNSLENEEFLYAAVDPLDHVFVARVRPRSGLMLLSRYKLRGTQLTDFTQYMALNIVPTTETWCKLVCLSPRLLAFASMTKKLYFIKI
ncbi:uncharacterized protein LOC121407279 [Lytechinus variegatus]|uniref:uncharacterized protein LOC121407279 n=1 Tax=Lytechinus variegatus TaxID=7654 RepID=UPI001BB14FCA|nr:uncharacterized protein LOC121407279 [Lytechinus variegatus]